MTDDEPEGEGTGVLVSVALIKEWAALMNVTIVSWGRPVAWAGMIYEPTIRKEDKSRGRGMAGMKGDKS